MDWVKKVFILAALVFATGCGSMRFGTAYSLDDIKDPSKRPAAVQKAAGFTPSNGVPNLDERFAKRKPLKLAVLQMSTYVQGDIDQKYKDIKSFSMLANTYGGTVMTWTDSVVPGVEVPPEVGISVANQAMTAFEAELQAKGFEVIPGAKVVATKAYQGAYGAFPPYATVVDNGLGPTLAQGWTGFAPKGFLIHPPTGAVEINTAKLSVDAKVLKELKAELGDDVLFAVGSIRIFNHDIQGKDEKDRTRVGKFGSTIGLTLLDPEFVGYGIGGHGHIAGSFDVKVKDVPRPEFIKRDPAGFKVDWKSMVDDADVSNKFMSEAIATLLKELAYPPAKK